MAPHSSTLGWKIHGQRSLVGYSPWGLEESDTTERLHFHFSLSCIGEGNGNPLQCSCLENPRDREAWWAAIHWVAQSWTWLKRLSSSSSSKTFRVERNKCEEGMVSTTTSGLWLYFSISTSIYTSISKKNMRIWALPSGSFFSCCCCCC